MRISRPVAVAITAGVFVVAMLILAGFAIWSYFRPDPRFEGIPKLEYYVTDEVGVLYNYYEVEDICYTVDVETSCEMAVLVVNSTCQGAPTSSPSGRSR